MALSPLGVLDLSIVTDQLISMLNDCITSSPLWSTLNPPTQSFTIHVSGSMPETKRKLDGCQLTVSLLHVTQDKHQRNSAIVPPVTPVVPNPPPPRAQTLPFQPLSLDLYYLVTAYADDKYVEEQQAMSIVLNCFHQNPIVRKTVVIPGTPPQSVKEEFTLTMEIETSDELGRLWQAITVPYRLSAVYRVGVVFLTPPAPGVGAKQVARAVLAVDPTTLPYQQSGQVTGTLSSVTYATPASAPLLNKPEVVTFNYSPATVTVGQTFVLFGGGLNQSTSGEVYLLIPDSSSPTGFKEQDVTAWKLPDPNPNPPNPNLLNTDSRLTLAITSPPAPPDPGVYQLRVGNALALGNAAAVRSNATPFSIAAPVNVTIAPPNPPILVPDGSGTYTVKGQQFIASMEVLLDTVALTPASGALQAGTFKVVDPQTITFQRPTTLPSGVYAVRIRVNQVESPPGWWIQF